jgi:endonuclease/exonuclease/phosphatase family metal-dependent hydrolase
MLGRVHGPTLRALAAAILLAGCATATLNYTDPTGPRYAGGVARATNARDTLKLVSFNVKLGRRVDRAVRVFREEMALHDPDIVFLQEMDEPGTQAIADSLGLAYVYYPSTLHPKTKRDFGNAVLSRYPIEDDRKIPMPHLARIRHIARAGVGATIRVGDRRLRVYSVHMGTFVGNGPHARREQFAAVLADADAYPSVVVAGDFNSGTVPEVALTHGFSWPTQHLGHTSWLWDMDHVLLKGVALAGDSATGVIHDARGASDHRPVWARIVLRPATSPTGPAGSATP